MTYLRAGSTIGIFGGGQLGRMLSQAAARLGYKTHIFDPAQNTPAGDVAALSSCGAYEDLQAVRAFSRQCQVITYEWENIPVETIRAAKHVSPVYPFAEALETAQDRMVEKTYLRDKAGAPVVGFYQIDTLADLKAACAETGFPCVLKTRRFGYDGKGQMILTSAKDIESGFDGLGGKGLILETYAPFRREVSIIAARGLDGECAFYPLTENVHKNHILHTSTAPAPDPKNVEEEAQAIASRILKGLSYVGVMGIEFFEMQDGSLIVNEIAPRVHNSGHWTMDGGSVSQFEQHIRAITGLPLQDTSMTKTVVMTNLIGEDINQADALAKQDGCFVHDYGKKDIRAGRKMGHVNKVE